MTCCELTANLVTTARFDADLVPADEFDASLTTAAAFTANICGPLAGMEDVGACPITDAVGDYWVDATGAYVNEVCDAPPTGRIFTRQFTRQFV